MSHNREERLNEEQEVDLDALDHGADTPPPRRRRTNDEVPRQQGDWKGLDGDDDPEDEGFPSRSSLDWKRRMGD